MWTDCDDLPAVKGADGPDVAFQHTLAGSGPSCENAVNPSVAQIVHPTARDLDPSSHIIPTCASQCM